MRARKSARHRSAQSVLIVMVAALAAGCAGPREDGQVGTNASPDATVAAPATSCGEFHFDQGDAPPPASVPADAWDCLDAAAAAGEEAMVVTSAPTTEGDPIVVTYSVGPLIDGLEIVEDHRADKFGVQDVERRLCPDTVTTADPQGCQEV